jgi:hypothetical protein
MLSSFFFFLASLKKNVEISGRKMVNTVSPPGMLLLFLHVATTIKMKKNKAKIRFKYPRSFKVFTDRFIFFFIE